MTKSRIDEVLQYDSQQDPMHLRRTHWLAVRALPKVASQSTGLLQFKLPCLLVPFMPAQTPAPAPGHSYPRLVVGGSACRADQRPVSRQEGWIGGLRREPLARVLTKIIPWPDGFGDALPEKETLDL